MSSTSIEFGTEYLKSVKPKKKDRKTQHTKTQGITKTKTKASPHDSEEFNAYIQEKDKLAQSQATPFKKRRVLDEEEEKKPSKEVRKLQKKLQEVQENELET